MISNDQAREKHSDAIKHRAVMDSAQLKIPSEISQITLGKQLQQLKFSPAGLISISAVWALSG